MALTRTEELILHTAAEMFEARMAAPEDASSTEAEGGNGEGRRQIAELLVERGALTEEQADRVLDRVFARLREESDGRAVPKPPSPRRLPAPVGEREPGLADLVARLEALADILEAPPEPAAPLAAPLGAARGGLFGRPAGRPISESLPPTPATGRPPAPSRAEGPTPKPVTPRTPASKAALQEATISEPRPAPPARAPAPAETISEPPPAAAPPETDESAEILTPERVIEAPLQGETIVPEDAGARAEEAAVPPEERPETSLARFLLSGEEEALPATLPAEALIRETSPPPEPAEAPSPVPSAESPFEPEESPPGDAQATWAKILGEAFKPGAAPAPEPPAPADPAPGSASIVTPEELWLHCPPLEPAPVRKSTLFIIGRSADSDLALPVAMVSRRHATISWDGAQWLLSDIESENGTYLNEARISKAPVKPGDRIRIGPYEIVVATEGEPSALRGGSGLQTRLVPRGDVARKGMSGELATLPLPDVIQSLAQQRKTGAVRLRTGAGHGAPGGSGRGPSASSGRGEEAGTLWLVDGEVVDARAWDQRGEAAFRALLWLTSGSFQFSPEAPHAERTIGKKTHVLLMDAMRDRELTATVTAAPPGVAPPPAALPTTGPSEQTMAERVGGILKKPSSAGRPAAGPVPGPLALPASIRTVAEAEALVARLAEMPRDPAQRTRLLELVMNCPDAMARRILQKHVNQLKGRG
ncbi:MAG: FHA domain-containing protein [Planctomycetales bacterium]|nr:FHA domain-containing protein [Planctomycetales bacterium]